MPPRDPGQTPPPSTATSWSAAGDRAARRAWREQQRRNARRRRWRRRLQRLTIGCAALLAVAIGSWGGLRLAKGAEDSSAVASPVELDPAPQPLTAANGPVATRRTLGGKGSGGASLDVADGTDTVRVPFGKPPRAGLLFDLDTGEVLWRRNPTRRLPIASVTKMMTALVVTDKLAPDQKIRITPAALDYTGSGVGVLPVGKWVGQSAMLHGLLLSSGNDAAIALARQAGRGSVPRFIRMMNARAERMGLTCTRFASPSGIVDEGNYSCPADLAVLGAAVLEEPRLARIVRRKYAVLPFPIKGGKLFMANHNPLLKADYPGTLGIKTGYTDAAGLCLVAAVRRGGHRYGVVLLHSPNPGLQARQLLARVPRASQRS